MANHQHTIPPNLQSPTTLSLVVATAIVSSLAGYFLGQASGLGIFGSSSSSRSSRRSSKRKRKTERRRVEKGRGGGSDLKAEDVSRDIKATLAAAAAAGGGDDVDAVDGEGESEASSIASSSSSSSEEDENERDSTSHPTTTTTSLSTFAASTEDFKMTLLLRTDLGMTKGKMAAQAAHAALLNYTLLQSSIASISPSSSQQTTTHPALRKWQRSGQAKIALQVGSLEELEDVRRKAVEVGLCAGVVRDAGRTQVAGGSVTACAVGPGPRGVVDGVSGGLRLL